MHNRVIVIINHAVAAELVHVSISCSFMCSRNSEDHVYGMWKYKVFQSIWKRFDVIIYQRPVLSVGLAKSCY